MNSTPPKPRRLDQLLANLGYCTRSQSRKFVRANEVTAGGVPVLDPSQKVEPSGVMVNGEPLDSADGLLLMMNKPAGYVCSHDPADGPTIFSLLPEQWMFRNPKPSSVGRLDKDTTGLILITDMTGLIHRMTSPKTHVEKRYLVTVDGPFPPNIVERFAAGSMMLSGEEKPCLPAALTLKSESEAEVMLTEGRYHQVKKMFAACGCTVTRLHRDRFGIYELGDLAEGEWRELEASSASNASE